MTQMQPELKVQVLEDKRLVFGDPEMRLLEAIARQGTLAEGAAELGLSYRSAWGKLRAAEASLGLTLVETTMGGSGGGSSRLTTAAQRLVSQYTRFRDAVGAYAIEEFARCFADNGSPPSSEADAPAHTGNGNGAAAGHSSKDGK